MSGRLDLASPEDVADAAAFLGRAVRLDPAVLVRLRGGDAGSVALWCWLPMDVLVCRSVRGSVTVPDVAVQAAPLLAALAPTPPPPPSSPPPNGTFRSSVASTDTRGTHNRESLRREVQLPPRRDAQWRGALPRTTPGERLDGIPADVIARLLAAGEQAFRQASASADPQAVGDALLDQNVLTVSAGSAEVGVPLKGLLALARMGFLSAGRPEQTAARPMDVAIVGGWLRLSADYGDAYLRRGGGLGLFPAG